MEKKVTFTNSRNLTLVATAWSTHSDKIIIMAHGSGNNRFGHGLLQKIALSLQAHGYDVLSFDFSGHGESQDDIMTLEKSTQDMASTIAFVKNQGYKHIALFGHSLGAYACLSACTSDIETMVLIGALSGSVEWQWQNMATRDQITNMHTTGYIQADVNDGLRKTLKIDGNLLNDILHIDQEKLFKQIICPILFIHGDADFFEQSLSPFSKNALKLLPEGSELTIIPGATHAFTDHVEEVIQLTRDWYDTHIKS